MNLFPLPSQMGGGGGGFRPTLHEYSTLPVLKGTSLAEIIVVSFDIV